MNIFKINKEEMEKNVIHDFDQEEPEVTKKSKNKEPLANWAVIVVVLILVSFAILLAVLAILKFSDKEETVKEVTYSFEEVQKMLEDESNKSSAAQEEARIQGREETLEELKISLMTGDSVIRAIRPFYPDELVLAANGAYVFVPIDRTLSMNQLEQAGVQVLENGEYQYVQDENVVSRKGIDVSSHQGKIKWDEVAGDGVEFAFIRAVYRGYGSAGKLMEDERFDANMQGAINNGIEVGAYVFTQAVTEEEVLEEARLAIQKVSKYTDDCTIVVDVEKTADAAGRMNALTPEERTRLVKLFCETVEEAGYKPMIYFNLEMAVLMLDLEELEEYDKWFAAYSDTLYYPYDYEIWQYSEKGEVAGISGPVDLDISFGKLSD